MYSFSVFPCFAAFANDLVFHVRDVHHVVQREPAIAKPAAQDVLERERAQVSNVYVVINSRSARVHAYGVPLSRMKVFELLRESVVQT